jgi:hypothetical protein
LNKGDMVGFGGEIDGEPINHSHRNVEISEIQKRHFSFT